MSPSVDVGLLVCNAGQQTATSSCIGVVELRNVTC
jgi:hypothetical protein